MLFNQPGQSYFCEDSGHCLSIGQQVVANSQSPYSGLIGTVREIRDGEDKETLNPTVDIYCDFVLPDSRLICGVMEERFGGPADTLTLTGVVMAPLMLEPKMAYQVVPTSLHILTYYVDSDIDKASENDSPILAVSDKKEELHRMLVEEITINPLLQDENAECEIIEGDVPAYMYVARTDKFYLCYAILEVPFAPFETRGKHHAS